MLLFSHEEINTLLIFGTLQKKIIIDKEIYRQIILLISNFFSELQQSLQLQKESSGHWLETYYDNIKIFTLVIIIINNNYYCIFCLGQGTSFNPTRGKTSNQQSSGLLLH